MKDKVIVLTNGMHVNLSWSMLVLEYLEEYPGGVSQIEKDIKARRHEIKLNNMLCYAVIRANIDKPMTYTEIIQLLDIKCVRTILELVKENCDMFDEFKKKRPNLFAKLSSSEEEIEPSLNRAKIIYNGAKFGLNKDEVMRLHPIEYMLLIELYNKEQKAKYGVK